jgi:hypothetical protein
VLCPWHLDFNPWKEVFPIRHLWCLLPNLPLHFWLWEVFIYVANSIGLFIQLEDRIFIDPDKRMPRVLVELEVDDGLPTELDIRWEGGVHVQ